MPEILGYSLGGTETIPVETFAGDDVIDITLGRIFFTDESSPFYVPAALRPEVSDGEFILDLAVDAARRVKQNGTS